MPKFLLKFESAVIKEIPVNQDAFNIGRKPDNDIIIDHPAVSSHHCRISLQGGVYIVEDLESTNGTYVNQKRIKKAGLHHNDVVGVAKHSLIFFNEAEMQGASAPAAQGAPTKPVPQKDSAAQAPSKKDGPAAALDHKIGFVRVLKGVVGGNSEYELKGPSTYIGGSDRAQIRIQGGGLLHAAPAMAASIHRKPEGYFLSAVEEGYPLVNSKKVTSSVLLKEGDFIECGGTTMQFSLKDAPANAAHSG